MNTAFPYGLNDRVNIKSVQDAYSYVMENTSTNLSIYELFNKVPSRRTSKGGKKRTHQGININNNVFNPVQFMNSMHLPGSSDKHVFINFVRDKIMRLSKADTKTLFLHHFSNLTCI